MNKFDEIMERKGTLPGETRLNAALRRLRRQTQSYYLDDVGPLKNDLPLYLEDLECVREAFFAEHSEHEVHVGEYAVGTLVVKEGGDYRFVGRVVSAFAKRSGQVRYVVENADGILHIFSESQLKERT